MPSITGFLRDVTRGIETDHRPGCEQTTKNEGRDQRRVQQPRLTKTRPSSIRLGHQYRYLLNFVSSGKSDGGSKKILTRCSEHLFRRTEPVCFGYPDGKPDKAQEEVDEIQPNGELEYERIHSRGEVIDGDGQH